MLLYKQPADPPDLHSFPTRRSSDLASRAAGPGGRPRHPRAGHGHRVDGVHQAPAGVDRKSTRLNSSHVEISYAVFCLKKKNKIHTRRRSKILQMVTMTATYPRSAPP